MQPERATHHPPVRSIDELEVASLDGGEIGHLTLVAVRVGDDPALGRLGEDLGQSVGAPRTL